MASGLGTRLRAALGPLGAGAALAGLLLVAPPAYAEDPAPPSAPLDQRFAGNRAGEGRARPGRPPGTLPFVPDESAQPIADAFSSPTPPPPLPSAQPAVAPKGRPSGLSGTSDLRVHVLSMGAGLTLTGLGLAFLALRLRRP
ncbi:MULTISPECIES: hypothetical protein [unclassified Streptomyces]|uniref:hypothetical protein n=1 Tax=unclassified Streptomyces TaxID=2593676 RepID=UPI0034047807